MNSFADEMCRRQIDWRRRHLSDQRRGRQNGHEYDHVLPHSDWELNLWPGIGPQEFDRLTTYLKAASVKRHTGAHNLLSSWTLCANLYFPFRSADGPELLAEFLRHLPAPGADPRLDVLARIDRVTRLELEYECDDDALKPSKLLGELGGTRGSGQTSPDLALEVVTDKGRGLVLVESKFTEHSFYSCSGRRAGVKGRTPNPDPTRCLNFLRVLDAPDQECHLRSWDRTYWKHLAPTVNRSVAAALDTCPAAFGGYQLFRQQALAEGIARSGRFEFVVSAVAYDARNPSLMQALGGKTGIADVRTGWAPLFGDGNAIFASFTHQAWVEWVASKAAGRPPWTSWLDYVRGRYGFGVNDTC